MGHADPCAVAAAGGNWDGEGSLAVSQEEAAHLDVPDGYTPEMARE